MEAESTAPQTINRCKLYNKILSLFDNNFRALAMIMAHEQSKFDAFNRQNIDTKFMLNFNLIRVREGPPFKKSISFNIETAILFLATVMDYPQLIERYSIASDAHMNAVAYGLAFCGDHARLVKHKADAAAKDTELNEDNILLFTLLGRFNKDILTLFSETIDCAAIWPLLLARCSPRAIAYCMETETLKLDELADEHTADIINFALSSPYARAFKYHLMVEKYIEKINPVIYAKICEVMIKNGAEINLLSQF